MASKSFIVNRRTWHRGGKPGTFLLDYQGGKCCLGFYSKSCGIKDSYLLCKAWPSGILTKISHKLPKWLQVSTEDMLNLGCINDDKFLSEEEREERITKIFNKHHIKVKFVG